MFYVAFFIIEIVFLFFLSRLLTQLIFRFLLQVTRDHETTIHILSFLFLPGVIVHELSHMFMASILFVRVGEMEFWPKIHGNFVKLGSVQIAKTDPLRRFLIGVAPLIGGIGMIMLLFAYVFSSRIFSWQIVLFMYSLFEIGNTMFSSKKDMEGAIVLFIAVFLFSCAAFFLGLRFDLQIVKAFFTPSVVLFFQKLDIVLLVPVVLNTVFCTGMKYFLRKI